MQFRELLYRVLAFFTPKDKPKSRTITNTIILRELESCFKKTIEEQSMEGRRMLYDSHFITLLHPEDYQKREQTLPFVVKEAINGFYEIIQKNKKNYGNQPFVPTTKSWYLQFLAKEEFLEEEIKRGELKIISIFSTEVANNGAATGTIKVTFKPKLSTGYESRNINADALTGMDIIGKGFFSVKFDPALGKIEDLPRSAGDGLAQFTYTLQNKIYTYVMHEPEIIISGQRADGTYPPNTLVIDSNFLSELHARVKYDAATKRFFIAAFANARVNEVALRLSQGDDINWTALAPKSNLMLGMFGIHFKNLLEK